MNKKYIPFAHAKSLHEIDIDFFKKLGIKTILVDLDNTLDSYKVKKPSENTVELIKKFKTHDINVIIVSNNRSKRVKPYADMLGIKMTSMNMKPFPNKIKKLMRNDSLNASETILVGDQLLTDVIAGNKAGLKTILVDRLTKEDQKMTRIRRIFERPKIAKLRKLNLLKEWRDILDE